MASAKGAERKRLGQQPRIDVDNFVEALKREMNLNSCGCYCAPSERSEIPFLSCSRGAAPGYFISRLLREEFNRPKVTRR